ncbi:MAG: TonB-dependent siderophore receptor [Halomonas sp.]|nr:TonB-dependent siderophore receptor [Halomonas sp.]MDN6298041.1 TonB-dependent siderophore receptor [Halomonas sp.]MDN6314553.1 TonB-dependent siderophore receptor [Halomonas sp.]
MGMQRIGAYRAFVTFSSVVALLGASQSVLAQSAPDSGNEAEASRLDTVTVEGNRLYHMLPSEVTGGYTVDAATVGTKTPAALRDIPQSISVVTRDAIDDQNFTTLDELGRRTTGMRVLSNDNGRSSIYARGYEYDEANIDGLPAPMTSINGSVPSLAAFDRVEIMRGPSGLFNSTSEMGGIVNLVRKRPTDEFQGSLGAGAGTQGQRNVQTDLSGPLDEAGRVRGRLVLDRTDHPEIADHTENEQYDIYAALDVDVTDDTTLGLAFIRNKKDIVVNNGQPVDANGNLTYGRRSAFYGADWNDFSSQSNDVLVDLTHSFDNGGYGRIGMRYSDRNADYNYAFGGSALNDDGTLGVAGVGADASQEAFSLDASYSQPFSAFGNVSEFVVGTDYKRYDTDVESSRTKSLAANPVTRQELNDLAYTDILAQGRQGAKGFRYGHDDTRQEETGVYSKLTLRPIQSLALIAGGRISHYETRSNDKISDRTERRSGTEFTPYAGAVYDLDFNHSLYASYSQVFKPQVETDASGDMLKPREGEQYEVGVKGSYFGGDLNTRVSAFRLYDENRAASVLDENYSAAVGKMRIQGAEVEVAGDLTPQWGVSAGYTYMDTEVKQASTSRDDGIFMLMPNNMVNLWTQYDFEGGSLDGLTLGGGVTAISGFESSQGVEAPGYAVVDAMLGYDFSPQFSGQLNFNNILDRHYYNRVGGTNTFNMVGAPSNVMASVRYEF